MQLTEFCYGRRGDLQKCSVTSETWADMSLKRSDAERREKTVEEVAYNYSLFTFIIFLATLYIIS